MPFVADSPGISRTSVRQSPAVGYWTLVLRPAGARSLIRREVGAGSLETLQRAFTGSSKVGAPVRQPGIGFAAFRGAIGYSVGTLYTGIKPDPDQIYCQSPLNAEGQYSGPLYAGRLTTCRSHSTGR